LASGLIQDSWLQAFNPDNYQACFAALPTGWTNNNIGLAFLKQVFNPSTEGKARQSYQLLILMAMDLTLQWILSIAAIRKESSLQYILLILSTRFSHLMSSCLSLSH
jgi:hypothetical protein